jgi:hypothetical protein
MSDSDVFFEPSADGGSYVSRTNELRFVSRQVIEPMAGIANVGSVKAVRILQQKFVIHTPNREEWRDVPLVDEAAPSQQEGNQG